MTVVNHAKVVDLVNFLYMLLEERGGGKKSLSFYTGGRTIKDLIALVAEGMKEDGTIRFLDVIGLLRIDGALEFNSWLNRKEAVD